MDIRLSISRVLSALSNSQNEDWLFHTAITFRTSASLGNLGEYSFIDQHSRKHFPVALSRVTIPWLLGNVRQDAESVLHMYIPDPQLSLLRRQPDSTPLQNKFGLTHPGRDTHKQIDHLSTAREEGCTRYLAITCTTTKDNVP